MLVYEKWTIETVDNVDTRVRHLYGTMGNVPSNSDNQLVYTDADGDILSDVVLNNTFVDDGHGGIIMIDSTGEETFVAANIKKSNNEIVNIVPGGNYEPEVKVLKSITFKKKPTKLEYTEGETIDITGAQVVATFESGEKEDVTSDCTFTPASALATTDNKITASYTYPETGESQVTKTATCNITVNAAQVDSGNGDS